MYFTIICLINTITMQEPKYFFKFTEAVNDNGTVWYSVQVHTKNEEQQPIIFRARYRELREIHQRCSATQYKNELPDFPHKKLFNNTNEQFIQRRKKQLQNYYNTLAKTMDIEKLPDLIKFIESHRKVKKVPEKQPKGVDEIGKIEVKLKKETKLRNTFQSIYKEVVDQFVDISNDNYFAPQEDHSKKFGPEIQKLKAIESKFLSTSKVIGHEDNDADFWSMFFMDENENIMEKSERLGAEFHELQKQLTESQKPPAIVVVK